MITNHRFNTWESITLEINTPTATTLSLYTRRYLHILYVSNQKNAVICQPSFYCCGKESLKNPFRRKKSPFWPTISEASVCGHLSLLPLFLQWDRTSHQGAAAGSGQKQLALCNWEGKAGWKDYLGLPQIFEDSRINQWLHLLTQSVPVIPQLGDHALSTFGDSDKHEQATILVVMAALLFSLMLTMVWPTIKRKHGDNTGCFKLRSLFIWILHPNLLSVNWFCILMPMRKTWSLF